MSNIERAQELLDQISTKCKDVVDFVNYEDFKLSTEDIIEYEKLTFELVDNLIHVDVTNVMNEGFICKFSEFETTFFLGKKHVLGLIIHIIQDITLFRNIFFVPIYVHFFFAVIDYQLYKGLSESKTSELKELKNKVGLIYQKQRHRLESNIQDFMKHKTNLGIQVDKLRAEKDNEPFDQLKEQIISHIPTTIENKKNSILILEKLIYLHNLDNLCNVMLHRSNNVPETEIPKKIAKHMTWISVLKEIKSIIDERILSHERTIKILNK